MLDFLTKREKHVLLVAFLLWCVTMVVPQRVLDQYELLFYVGVILPLGIYLLWDKERTPTDQD